MHEAIHNANALFDRKHVERFNLKKLLALGPEASFADAAEVFKIAEHADTLAFMSDWPRGQLAAVSAAIRSALRRTPRMPITFAWAPSYDYEITIWESAGIEGSPGEMTIMFRSRYPGDDIEVALPRVTAGRAGAAPKAAGTPGRTAAGKTAGSRRKVSRGKPAARRGR
jgi:hypothetical protein